MVDDVPPPLPVKQRSKSVLSEHSSVPRDDDGFGPVSSPQRHTTNLPSSADFVSSLESVLAELSEASAPKKPLRSARMSSYDNVTPSCDTVGVNGKCFKFPTFSVSHSSSASTQYSGSDESSNSSVLQNHVGSSDGLSSEYVVSAGREVSCADTSRVSQMSYGVVPMAAGAVPVQPATAVAPPLPMKLKHSQSPLYSALTSLYSKGK